MIIENNSKDLVGKFLVASPFSDMVGTCFDKSVIYILSHNDTGTLGVIVNRTIDTVKASFLCEALEVKPSSILDKLPIHFGGPVESGRGLIIHSDDYKSDTLMSLDGGVSLSSNLQIIQDIAGGNGPSSKLIILGYSGWAPGQLDDEIKRNSWLTVPFDRKLVFSEDNGDKWEKAVESLGFSYTSFATVAGNA